MKKSLARGMFVTGLVGVGFLVALVVPKNNVQAAIDSATLMKKWIFTEYYSCLKNGSDLNTPIETQDNTKKVSEAIFKDTNDRFLPSYSYQHTISGNLPVTSCKNILIGDSGGIKGVLDYYDSNLKNLKWSNFEGASEFLTEDIGYEFEDSGSGEQIFNVSTICTKTETKKNVWTGKLKEPKEVECDDNTVSITVTPQSDGSSYYSYSWWKQLTNDLQVSISDGKFSMHLAGGAYCTVSANASATIALEADPNVFYENLGRELAGKTWTKVCEFHPYEKSSYRKTVENYYFSVDKEDIVNVTDKGKYVYKDTVRKAKESTLKLAGVGSLKDLVLSDSERYSLYFYYLGKYLPANVQDRMTCNPSGANPEDYLYPVKLKDSDGTFKQCYVNLNGQDSNATEVTTQFAGSRGEDPYIDKITMQGVLDWFNSAITNDLTDVPMINEIEGGTGVIIEGGTVIDPSSGSSEGDPCYDAGVQGVSWLLCPAINNITSTMDGIDKTLRDMLSISPELYKSDGAAAEAWGRFRDIANVLIIIVFLIIIFSQLTGYGIDNYGIKKMLPKLVVMAILINLSFILCQLAIDLSNITGVGLKNLLQSIGEPLYGGYTAGEFFTKLSGALLAVAATGASASGIIISAVAVGTGGAGPMIIISLVLAVLVALVAILFFFIMLGARMIIVILFTAIAPLAFVCYILPNTQSLFKKWWNVFKAALLIYPICGALYGMSFIIRGIIFSGDGGTTFWMALIAVFAPFLPFFLLPTLLKGAIAAVGAVGGAIAGIGSSVRRGISGANQGLKMTEAYKNEAEMQRRQTTRWRAGVDKQGKEIDMSKMSKFSKMIRGGNSGIAKARSQYVRDLYTGAKESNLTKPGSIGFAAAIIEQQKAAEKEETGAYMVSINDATRNGEDEEKLFSLYDQYVASGDKAGAVAVARIAGRRKDTAASFMRKKMTDDSVIGGYDDTKRGIFRSVAKEVSTGENSGAFRESSPLGFEFVAQTNRDASTPKSYSEWLSQTEDKVGADGVVRKSFKNVHDAVDHYVTNSKELVGAKNSSLGEMADLMEQGKMDKEDIDRLSGLATETIRNRGMTGVWDTTKAENIYRIANRGKKVEPITTETGSQGVGGGQVRQAGNGGVIQVATEGDLNDYLLQVRKGEVGGLQSDGGASDERRIIERRNPGVNPPRSGEGGQRGR